VKVDRRSALIAAAAGAMAAGGRPGAAAAQRGSDRDLLERLLAEERGLQSMYEAAARRGLLVPGVAELLRDHERQHAEGIEEALSGTGRAPVASVPSAELTRAVSRGTRAFLRYALRIESEAVAAYANAVTNLRDPDLLQPLGSIMASEGQHLVVLRELLGARPSTRAYETGRKAVE